MRRHADTPRNRCAEGETMNKILVIRTLNALLVLVLMGVLLSAYYQQFFKHEMPCPLCILQRLGMIGVSVGLLMNLRFGIRPEHYALSLLSAFMGGAVSIRQILLHICPGFPVFGIPVFGLSLYTWAFIVFCCSALAIIGFLFFYSPKDKSSTQMNYFEIFTFGLVFTITLMNFFTTFYECGVGFCLDVPWPQP
jgi:disulfide bond formation protein DsbB